MLAFNTAGQVVEVEVSSNMPRHMQIYNIYTYDDMDRLTHSYIYTHIWYDYFRDRNLIG